MAEGRRWLIVGRSGSGKTTLARTLAGELASRLNGRIVVLSTRVDQLAGLAGKPIYVDQPSGERVTSLLPVIDKRGAAHFIVNMVDPNPFIKALGEAMLNWHGSVLVLDEAHLWLHDRAPDELKRVITEGRARNVHVVMITQQSGSSGGYGLATIARNNVDVVVAFNIVEKNELTRLSPLIPNAPDLLPSLQVPGEYVVRDLGTGEMVRVRPDGATEQIM